VGFFIPKFLRRSSKPTEHDQTTEKSGLARDERRSAPSVNTHFKERLSELKQQRAERPETASKAESVEARVLQTDELDRLLAEGRQMQQQALEEAERLLVRRRPSVPMVMH
jgi:hypothetical protein